MKKNIILAVIIIGVILLLVLVYFFYFRKNQETTPTSTEIKKIEKVITQNKIYFPALSETGKEILYFDDKEQGNFYAYSTEDGQSREISGKMNRPEMVIWSPRKDKAVIDYTAERSYPLFQIYDFKTETSTPLDLHIQNIAWAHGGEKIIYHYYAKKGQVNNISIGEPNGTNWRKLTDIQYEEGVGLIPYSENEIYYYPLLTEIGGEKIFQLNLEDASSREAIKDNIASGAKADSDGNLIFQFYHKESQSYSLALLIKNTQKIIDLEIQGEMDKVGVSLKDGVAIVASPQDKNGDKFYQIDLKNGSKKEINYSNPNKINAYNLIFSADNKTIYFTSEDYLYKLDL